METLEKMLRRAEKYKKEAEASAQNYARLHKESRAREEGLTHKIKEAVEQASRSESKLQLAANKMKLMQERLDEEGRRHQRAVEEISAAKKDGQAAAGRAAAVEKAAAEIAAEKAGAVACANEASARAEEAENKAWEAENRAKGAELRAEEAELKAQQAETGLARAVEKYKSSPLFKQEVMEASLDAYFKGFDECKSRVSTALKVEAADLEKIQPEDPDEAEGGEGADKGGEEAEANKGGEEAEEGGEKAEKDGEKADKGEP